MKTNIVAKKISTLCTDRNITKAQLAERAGLSVDQLTLIENSSTFPSLAPLIKIARALGVRLGTFLDDSYVTGPVVHRANDSVNPASFSSQLSNANSHLDFFPLAARKSDRTMEPFLIQIRAEEKENMILSSHEGEEFLYVLSGTIRVRYGFEEYVLNSGDSIYYDSVVEHLVYAGESGSAQILAVVYTPS